MARKATDLLDVFRFADESEDDQAQRDDRRGRKRAPKERPAKRAAAAPSRRGAEGRGGAEGLQVNRRQLVFGSSAIVLLLVLSFVLGLSTGRSRTPTGGAAIQRQVPRRIAIRGELPRLDPATQQPVEPAEVARLLKRDFGLDAKHLRVEPRDGFLVIDVGPFNSEEAAARYLRDSGLELLHLHMDAPFRAPKFAAWRSDD